MRQEINVKNTPHSAWGISNAQRVMMREFEQKMFEMWEKYWNPTNADEYWDALTEDAMNLLSQFQSKDNALNNFLSNIVAVFLNSREDMLQ